MENIEFLVSLGYECILTSILTMIIMQLIKKVMKKRGIITEGIEENYKDQLLSRIGRICVIIIYILVYLVDGYFIKGEQVLKSDNLASLGSGIVLTLTLTKGIYTTIKQISKKKNVYEKLKVAEDTINQLKEVIKENKEAKPQEILEKTNENIQTKWILKNKEN